MINVKMEDNKIQVQAEITTEQLDDLIARLLDIHFLIEESK